MKLEDLEKTCKKIHKVRTRMVAVRMVRVFNMYVEETASIMVRCPTWVHHWLRRYDEGGLEGGMRSEGLARHAWWVGGGQHTINTAF